MNRDLEFCRCLFAETALENAVRLGTEQYVIFYPLGNRFAYKKPHWAKALRVFEVDRLSGIQEKLEKLERERVSIPKDVYYIEGDCHTDDWVQTLLSCDVFCKEHQTVMSLFGVSQAMGVSALERFLKNCSSVLGEGGAIVFDYIDETMGLSSRSYSEFDMELLLSRCGFRLYEHVNAEEMRQQYLRFYNLLSKQPSVIPPSGMNYCLAVKK